MRIINLRGTIAFDTLEYMDELKRSGMDQEQAEAITKATAKALSQAIDSGGIATQQDIFSLKDDIKNLEVKIKDFIHAQTFKIITTISVALGMFIALNSLIEKVF
jgi:hypothetical protein